MKKIAPRKKLTAKPKPIEPIYVVIGSKLAMIREALGLTQSDVATKSGQSRASVANIENGRQRLLLNDIERFARALGTTPKHIMRGIWL